MTRPLSTILSASLLLGCPGPDGTSDDTGGGTIDTEPHYDEGCITVDGGGGYAHLQDAITVAAEGSVIALCAGTWDESVTVDKAVTIEGVSGTLLVGQGTDPALRISAGATISDLAIQSTYSGIVVDGANGATIRSVQFDAPAYWGLQATNAIGTTVVDVLVSAPGGGGVQISGGSATLENLTVDFPSGFGVQVINGADVFLSGSVVNGVILTSEDVTDGFGIEVVDASLTTDANTVDAPGGMGIYAENAVLDLNGDTLIGAAFLGVYAVDTTVQMSGVSILESDLQGAYIVGPSFQGDGLTIATTPADSCSITYDQWGGNNNGPWCGGLLVVADGIQLTNSQVSGSNNYGVYLQGNNDLTAPILVEGLTISDTGRWGLNLYQPNATITGLTLTSLREPEMDQPCQDTQYIYLDRSVGVLVQGGNLDLGASNISANSGWGVSNVQGQVTIHDSTFDTNACSSVLNYQGATGLTGNTFSGAWAQGNIWDYQGATIVDGNHFVNNHTTYYGSYESDGHLYSYNYTGAGQDIYGYSSSSLEVSNNVFEDGDRGVSLYLSSAEVFGNSWTGYDGPILYSYQSAATFTDNSVDDFGGYLGFNYYGSLEYRDVTAGTQRDTMVDYQSYEDGVLVSEFSYSTASSAFYSYTSSDYPASITLDGVSIDSAPYGLIQSYDTDLEFYDVSVGSAGTAYGSTLLTANWQSVSPVVTMDGVSANQLGGPGIYLYNSTTYPSYVDMSGIVFESVSGTAVASYYLSDWTISDSVFGDVGDYGVYAVTNSTTPGTATLDEVSVSGASTRGYFLQGGTAVMSASMGTTSGSGLELFGVDASVDGNQFVSNNEYGMVCRGTTLTSCTGNDLSGNLAGAHSGCDDACGTSTAR